MAAMTPPAPDLATLLKHDRRRGHASAHLEQIALGLLEYFRQLVPVLTSLAAHPSFSYPSFSYPSFSYPSFSYPAFTKRHPNSPLERLVTGLMSALEDKRKRGEVDCPDVGSAVLNLVATAYGPAMFEQMGAHDGEFGKGAVRDLARVLWGGIAPADQRHGEKE